MDSDSSSNSPVSRRTVLAAAGGTALGAGATAAWYEDLFTCTEMGPVPLILDNTPPENEEGTILTPRDIQVQISRDGEVISDRHATIYGYRRRYPEDFPTACPGATFEVTAEHAGQQVTETITYERAPEFEVIVLVDGESLRIITYGPDRVPTD